MSIKQVLVVRKDLNMRKGKIAAQCSHASMAFMTRQMQPQAQSFLQRLTGSVRKLLSRKYDFDVKISYPAIQWISGQFAKVVVSVDSEKELLEIQQAARDAGIECHLVTDSGKTEFHGVPTKTVLALGPDDAGKIDKVTGHLKLL